MDAIAPDSFAAFHAAYLDLEDASRVLGMHPQSVRRLIKRGRVPARKVHGKFVIARPVVDQMAATYDTRPGRKPGPGLL